MFRVKPRFEIVVAVWALVLGCLVGVQPAWAGPSPVGARSAGFSIHVLRGPSGAQVVMLGLSDDGTAVGQEALGDGTSHGVIFKGSTLHDESGLLGNHSAFSAINFRDQMVGYLVPRGAASLADTSPFFLSGQHLQLLNVTGAATAINGAGIVVGRFTAPDGKAHAFRWNPATGRFDDLGLGLAFAINDQGTIVGKAANGDAASISPAVDLGFAGSLNAINEAGTATGHDDSSGGPKPIEWNPKHGVRHLSYTTPFGSATRINDIGLIGGAGFQSASAPTSTGQLIADPQLGPRFRGAVHRYLTGYSRAIQRLRSQGYELVSVGAINNLGEVVAIVNRIPGRAREAQNSGNPDLTVTLKASADPHKLADAERRLERIDAFEAASSFAAASAEPLFDSPAETAEFFQFLRMFDEGLFWGTLTSDDFWSPLGWKAEIRNRLILNDLQEEAVKLIDSLVDAARGPAVVEGNPTPVSAPPCACAAMGAFANHVTHPGHNIEGFEFDLHWAVICTTGAGPGCKGRIKVLPPPGEGIRLVRPVGAKQIASVDCHGPCGGGSAFGLGTGKKTVEWVTSRGAGFDLPNRVNKRFPLKLEFFCINSAGAEHLVGTSTLTLAFGKHGTLSYQKSDLNGDGKPDGGQLH